MTAERDRAVLREVGEYLAGLPVGLRSFPTCEADGRLLGGLAAGGVLDGLPLPPPLAEVVAGATSGRDAWVPEVVHVATILAVRGARFPGAGGDEDVVRWMAAASRPLALPGADGPRDPDAAVRAMPVVWARHHRGTTIEVTAHAERSASLVLHHPDGIFPPVVLEWRRRVLLAMLAASGAATPSAVLTPRTGTGTEVALAW